MSEDTIELPVFGLTLTRNPDLGDGWHSIGDHVPRVSAKRGFSYDYVHVSLQRGGVTVTYSAARETMDHACLSVIDQMTPDDVAAIRALGEP